MFFNVLAYVGCVPSQKDHATSHSRSKTFPGKPPDDQRALSHIEACERTCIAADENIGTSQRDRSAITCCSVDRN
jgi:hypothetical protein